MPDNIKIEVAFATPEQQTILTLVLPANSTIHDAVVAAKLFTGPIDALPVGIFGQLRTQATQLQDGDRVEIYRPLVIDPKKARQIRVKKERHAKRVRSRKVFG